MAPRAEVDSVTQRRVFEALQETGSERRTAGAAPRGSIATSCSVRCGVHPGRARHLRPGTAGLSRARADPRAAAGGVAALRQRAGGRGHGSGFRNRAEGHPGGKGATLPRSHRRRRPSASPGTGGPRCRRASRRRLVRVLLPLSQQALSGSVSTHPGAAHVRSTPAGEVDMTRIPTPWIQDKFRQMRRGVLRFTAFPCNPGGGSPSMHTAPPCLTGPLSTVRGQPTYAHCGFNAVHSMAHRWAPPLGVERPSPERSSKGDASPHRRLFSNHPETRLAAAAEHRSARGSRTRTARPSGWVAPRARTVLRGSVSSRTKAGRTVDE